MADDHARDELAQLRALVESQQVRLARLERPRRRLPRRVLPLALVALLVLLTPLSLLAASPFNDLTGGVHDANIGLIYDAGITKGCVPNISYCPTANVTREEMASFLARTAGLGTNPPVANAKTAQTATNATTADTLGGRAAADLARVANGQFQIEGNFANAASIPPGSSAGLDVTTVTIVAPGPGFVLVVAAGEALTDTISGCPCTVTARIIDRSATVPASPSVFVSTTLPNKPSGLFGVAALANTHVFPVVAGTRTYALNVTRIDGGTATIKADGALTAIFVPFGYNGGPSLAP